MALVETKKPVEGESIGTLRWNAMKVTAALRNALVQIDTDEKIIDTLDEMIHFLADLNTKD